MWLGIGVAILSVQPFQPDRRFLFLLPAVAVLASEAWHRGALQLRPTGAGPVPWQTVAAGALVGGWVGFVAWPLLVAIAGDGLPPPLLARTNPRGPTAVFALGVALGVLAFWWGSRRQRDRVARGRWRLSAILAVAFVAYDPGRFVWYLAHQRYFIRDAMREVTRVTSTWPDTEPVIFGDAAATLGLESQARPVMQITWGGRRVNMGAVDRFRPVALLLGPKPPVWVGERGFARCRAFPLRTEGRQRWPPLVLYTRPGYCPAAPAP
jgi:hypothetical protein